jgi:hypothetical protein
MILQPPWPADSSAQHRPAPSPLQVNSRVSNREIFAQYKFCIAAEQGLSRDFFTGMVFEHLLAGCVPIYLGADNVEEFVPANSVINYAAFDSVEAMMQEVARWAVGALPVGPGRPAPPVAGSTAVSASVPTAHMALSQIPA